MPEPEGVAPLGLVERLRAVHLQMVDAGLGGDGRARVAGRAAEAAGGGVALVVPRHDGAVASPAGGPAEAALGALRRSVVERARGRPAQVADGVVAEAAIQSGDELLGIVALVGPTDPRHPAA